MHGIWPPALSVPFRTAMSCMQTPHASTWITTSLSSGAGSGTISTLLASTPAGRRTTIAFIPPSWSRFPRHLDHDLADVSSASEVLERRSGLWQGEHAVNHGAYLMEDRK